MLLQMFILDIHQRLVNRDELFYKNFLSNIFYKTSSSYILKCNFPVCVRLLFFRYFYKQCIQALNNTYLISAGFFIIAFTKYVQNFQICLFTHKDITKVFSINMCLNKNIFFQSEA